LTAQIVSKIDLASEIDTVGIPAYVLSGQVRFAIQEVRERAAEFMNRVFQVGRKPLPCLVPCLGKDRPSFSTEEKRKEVPEREERRAEVGGMKHQDAARFQDSNELRENRRDIGHMLDEFECYDGPKCRRRKGKAFGIGGHEIGLSMLSTFLKKQGRDVHAGRVVSCSGE
jgi:hypothetical protein